MSKLRVLVLSANYGAGHVKAAEAIIEALYAKETDAQIAHVDFSEFLGKPLDSLIKNTYLEMIKHTPKLWGEFYYRTSRIEADSLLQRFLNGLGKREFVKFILSYRPDVIICTYPVIAGVLAQLKLKQIINVPLATVVTDYAVHNQWIHQGVDLYLVGCQEVLKGLVSRGVNPSRIKVTGIPVHPKFSTKLDKQALLNKFGLVSGLPTFLVMGGAYGVLGEVKRICEVLASAPTPVQTLVV
ncbi:MAG: UDP-N-acetylglucosamine--LPS N-acetylglucosamine transferase, partial [Bacillota bacterium]|nr:UDP-N-acetylglucosamine--LPS N-acetylglucosamine transferase [Bacillota bacterium]